MAQMFMNHIKFEVEDEKQRFKGTTECLERNKLVVLQCNDNNKEHLGCTRYLGICVLNGSVNLMHLSKLHEKEGEEKHETITYPCAFHFNYIKKVTVRQ